MVRTLSEGGGVELFIGQGPGVIFRAQASLLLDNLAFFEERLLV
jgi:hypothetical protein